MRLISIAVVATLTLTLGAANPALANNNRPNCTREIVSVKLTETATMNYNVVGWLCARGKLRNQPVQVLVSGLTYDHTYWDFPVENYSYVDFTNQLGFATFNIDRIGVGQSDQPPATEVTVPTEAFVTKQIVQALKLGKIRNHKFHKVIGVGHSLGAAIWTIEASFPDAGIDGLILADYTHAANIPFIVSIGAMRHPASEEDKFASSPTGYFTSIANTRGTQFYTTEFADSQVISKDEELKVTGTSGEATTINVARDPIYSNAIRVPVLFVVGQQDHLDCDEATVGLSCADNQAIRNREASLFSNSKSFKAFVLPKAGHSTNLHRSAGLFFLVANLWALNV
jgi:pimeloyl-ACP methyl ester carboxylesterase